MEPRRICVAKALRKIFDGCRVEVPAHAPYVRAQENCLRQRLAPAAAFIFRLSVRTRVPAVWMNIFWARISPCAPLMEETTRRAVYLPPGIWIDYQDGHAYSGGKWQVIEAGIIPGSSGP